MMNANPPPSDQPPGAIRNYLREWDLSSDEINEIIAENPPVYSTLSGFVAEYKLKKLWLGDSRISALTRPRSHDRTSKGDFGFTYRERAFTIEVKSLDTPKIRKVEGGYQATFQCNASDARPVELPTGERLKTNCLVIGEFDVLAVSLFAFERQWNFAFARNEDLPRSTWRRYTPSQQKYLLKSSMPITWPVRPPFHADLFAVLDLIVGKRGK